ncbi:MAG: pentapeptide repeat-containing protein [Candidatus Nitrosotenuis sp.]
MQNNIQYFVVLIMSVGITSLIPTIYADQDDNTVSVPFTKIMPVLDGKYTTPKEWGDAATRHFESNGYDFYLQVKQDKNLIYLMFNGVDFQTDPQNNSTSVRYQAVVCFNDGERLTLKQTGVTCFISTEDNEFGDHAKTINSVQIYTEDGKSKIIDGPDGYNSIWGFGNKNDPFEETEHLTYEAVIPKKILTLVSPGFGFSMYFGSSHDDLVQLTDGVIWPPNSDNDNPSTWGVLNLSSYKLFTPKQQVQKEIPPYKVYCDPRLELGFKVSDGSAVCVKSQSKEKLVERGWLKPTKMVSEVSHGVISEMIMLLEAGKVSEFNELRGSLVGRILFDKTIAPSMDLQGINLENIALPGARLSYANLNGANLRDADLSNANMEKANLENVDARQARFWNVNLQGANLKNANLQGASFKSTDLSGANLQGADLKGADLRITVNLQNMDLRGVKNLPISIEEAKERGAIIE